VGVLSEELVGFLRQGLAVIVATRDEELRPEIARGWAPVVDDERRAVTLCVCEAAGSRVRANLEANGAIAVTCSRPSTYRTVQLKGLAVDAGAPTEEHVRMVRRHLELFVEEVERLGVRPEGARTFLSGELLSVTFDVREVYDQTPGPKAGERL
jgi:hypothetical protein